MLPKSTLLTGENEGDETEQEPAEPEHKARNDDVRHERLVIGGLSSVSHWRKSHLRRRCVSVVWHKDNP